MKNLAICGLASAGKDTSANIICDNFEGFKTVSFGSPVKDTCASIFGWSRDMLEGDTIQSREYREIPDQYWSNKLNIPNFTPRKALQQIGTEVIKCNFNQNIWLYKTQRDIEILNKRGIFAIITDMRFINELEYVKSNNFEIIRIERYKNPSWFDNAVEVNKKIIEMKLQNWIADNVNDINFYDLIEKKTNINCNSLKEIKPHYSEWAIIGLTDVRHTITNFGTKKPELAEKVITYMKQKFISHQ